MKIGLIFPNKDRRYKTIHLGLASLAAYARENHNNLDFVVLDTRVATAKETKKFYNTPFNLVGITVFSPVYFEVKQIFQRIREQIDGAKICLGGPYVTTLMEEIFQETPADFAVYGEGEITFSELISHIRGERKPEDIPGLMYIDRNGVVKTNSHRPKIRDLDSLPRPAYELFPMNRYPLHRMVSSRGCPYACSWCNSSSIWNSSYRMNSPENMVAEMEYLTNNYRKKIFIFGDNTFNSDLQRLEKFCDLLLSNGLNILWSVSLRADNVTPEIAEKMKKAGCYNVAIGVESANNDVLRKMGKSTTIEKIKEGIKILKEAGIEIMSQYVIGSPHETFETFKESFDFAKNSGCDFTNFYTVLPFKGTPQWSYIEKNGTFFSKTIHDYHTMEPRIVFETPEFPYVDRLKAIQMVKKEGFYSNKDKKNWWFDVAKETSRKIQAILPVSAGERVYLLLKSIYRMKLVKKYNV